MQTLNKISASRHFMARRLPAPQLSMFSMFTLPSQHFSASKAKIPKSNNLIGMIEWYRRNGHKMAKTDPLQLQSM